MSVQKLRARSDVLHMSFNQDASCLSCGLVDGFRVFTCEDYKEDQSIGENFRRTFEDGGVGIVEMLFRSNLLALVGGGPCPKYPPNKVMIWDEHQGRCVGEIEFRTSVKAVKLRKDRIAVAVEHKTFVYNLEDLRHVYSQDTAPNPEGLLALSPSPDSAVLALPGMSMGQVRVQKLDTQRTLMIAAHSSPLSAITLSSTGKVLATASEKGTVIRTFSTADGSKLREFRRGSDPAIIYSLALSKGDQPDWLAVTSDKGTLHVFDISGRGGTNATTAAGGSLLQSRSGSGSFKGAAAAATEAGGIERNGSGETGSASGASPSKSSSTLSTLTAIGKRLPVGSQYFTPQRSFAQFNLQNGQRTVVAFGQASTTLLVASATGYFYKLGFDGERGGHCFVKNGGLCRCFLDLGNENDI